jgi:excisionase family DNA binding protein
MKQILTTGDVAKYCGVNLRTVIRWIERGHLKAYKLPGRGDNRIQMDDFLVFLEENRMPMPEALQNSVPNVLVVEKDDDIQAQIEKALSGSQPVNIRSVSNGFQAGVLLSSFNPRLIVIDVDSAREETAEIIGYLHSARQDGSTHTLLLSSEPEGDRKRFLKAGADEVLAKPLEATDFVKVFDRLCH